MKRKPWTVAEDRLMRKRYPHVPTQELATKLNRSSSCVYQRAAILGIRKSPEYLASPAAGQLRGDNNVGAACRFCKGNVPWNAGKKGWRAGGRSAETRFKPGHFPFNRDPAFYVIGALRVNADGYIDMRISFAPNATGWRALHTILWEDAHGPVPKGYALIFKDGDRLNVELTNIGLISRRDLMLRNSVHNLPPPLKSAIHLLGQVKRRIREKQNRGSAQPSIRDAGGVA